VTVTFFLVPLHAYDIVSLTAVVMLLFALPRGGRWLIVAGLLICLRARNLSLALGITNPSSDRFPESFLVSIALLLVLAGTVWALLQTLSAKPATI
jgi:hypothetical protein